MSTEDGLIGDAKEGNTLPKQEYRELDSLAVDLDLKQIVSKPTRVANILDLIFTDISERFTTPRVEILDPISDHNLVPCEMREGRQPGQSDDNHIQVNSLLPEIK